MKNEVIPHQLSESDLNALKASKNSMENIGLAIKAVNSVGSVAETTIKFLPAKILTKLQSSTKSILLSVVKTNLLTIDKKQQFKKPSKNLYKSIVTGTGAVSGFFGSTTGLGTAIFVGELSVTTKFLMRTIMDIARSEGEDIYSLEGQMACLEVFALGGASKDDDSLETSYYTTRAALNSSLQKVTSSGVKSILDGLVVSASSVGSKSLTGFVSKIAARFSILLSEKFLAQVVPVVGAATGGTINYIFVDHFQKMATAHFTIRRLERTYGKEIVKTLYDGVKV
ncbi:MAG: EcsC family protein [Aquaticitalea sp.]